jgi:hypothetical protein
MKERAAAVIPLEIGLQRWPERRAESCCELRMHGRRLPGASCVHLADGTVAASDILRMSKQRCIWGALAESDCSCDRTGNACGAQANRNRCRVRDPLHRHL